MGDVAQELPALDRRGDGSWPADRRKNWSEVKIRRRDILGRKKLSRRLLCQGVAGPRYAMMQTTAADDRITPHLS